jgi:hypothetical protein
MFTNGPTCTWSLCGDVKFNTFASKDKKTRYGSITKKWANDDLELLIEDSLKVKFPPNLNSRYKALILATCFLLEYSYYNDDPKDNLQAEEVSK